MRKLILLLVVAIMAATVSSVGVNAQVPITLSNLGSGTTTFTAGGSGTLDMTVGACTGGVLNSNAQIGTNCWSASNVANSLDVALFDFTSGTQVLTSLGGGAFSVAGPNIAFTLADFVTSSVLLTGNLQLSAFNQLGPANKLGLFNDQMMANLTVTGGTLATTLFADGQGELSVELNTFGGDLTALATGGGSPITAAFATADLEPAPEPGSMLLLGTGLLSFGGALRRRMIGR